MQRLFTVARLAVCAFLLPTVITVAKSQKLTSKPAPAPTPCPSLNAPIIPPKISLKSKSASMNSVMMVYTDAEYQRDICNYESATSVGSGFAASDQQLLRNKIVYGLKADIDVVFGKDFKKQFGSESGLAVLGDALTLGSTATASVATNTATKTLFAALGTAFAGVSLSIQKNYFGQQAFQILGTAMLTSRERVASLIDTNAKGSITDYPLEKAKSDLANYYSAGTLPGALAELQSEATAAKQVQDAAIPAVVKKPLGQD